MNLPHETSCSKNDPSLDILRKLAFQVLVPTCLLGMSPPISEALAPNQGHLGHQSCSASVLPRFTEFCCHPCSGPSLNPGVFLTCPSFSPAPTPNPDERGLWPLKDWRPGVRSSPSRNRQYVQIARTPGNWEIDKHNVAYL